MRKFVRMILLLLVLTLVLLIGVGVWIYWAVQQSPEWYAQAATAKNAAVEKQASETMEQRAADLVSGFETTGAWKVVFTEEEVNGWLAHGLPKKHPNLLPEGFSRPRVKIEADGVTGACEVEHGAVSGVVSLKVDVYLSEPNVVAIQFRRARLGRMPWPLTTIIDGLNDAAGRSEMPLSWRYDGADPVALITIPATHDKKRVKLETLQLEQGKLIISGVTERVK